MFQIYEFLPGAVTRTKQWDNLHYHNVLLELFFLRIHYHMQNKRIYMTLLMRFNWKQLPMWWNKWTGWVFDMKGIKMKVQPFTSGAQHRLSTYKEFRWNAFWKTIREKKPWDPYQLIATVLLNEVDFFLHESMRNMMARDSFLHLRLSLLINAL